MVSIKKITKVSLISIILFSIFVIWLNFYFVPEIKTYTYLNQSYEASITTNRIEMDLPLRIMRNIQQQTQNKAPSEISDGLHEAFERNKAILETKSKVMLIEIEALKENWIKLDARSQSRHHKSIETLMAVQNNMKASTEQMYYLISETFIEDIPIESLESIQDSLSVDGTRMKEEHLLLNEAILGDLNTIINILFMTMLLIIFVYTLSAIRFVSKEYNFIYHSFKALGSNQFDYENLPSNKSIFNEEQEMKTFVKHLFDERKFIFQIREILLKHYIIDDAIEALFEKLEKGMGIDRIGIAFVDYNSNRLIAEYSVANYDEIFLGAGFEVDINTTRLEQIIIDKQPIMTQDLEQDYREHPQSQALGLLSKERIQSNLVLPMTMGGAVFALLFLSSKRKHFFTQEHLILAEKIIYEIKGLLNRAYFTKVILSKITSSFSELVEKKDNETGEHINRMVNYSVAIAQGLGRKKLPGYEVDRRFILEIERNASSHDIGKVGIPDKILKKPGKLDKDEWEIMKTHVVIGADILKELRTGLIAFDPEFYQMAEEIARYHHEKWDGSGYPEGLKGFDIPLSARIVALADVFDALTSKRVYKEAFSLESSLDIIRSSRGSHLDPVVVDVFFENLETMKEIMYNSK